MASKSAASRQSGRIENLLGVFAQGTKAERQQGLLYYATQRDRVQKLGLKYGFTLEASAGRLLHSLPIRGRVTPILIWTSAWPMYEPSLRASPASAPTP